MNATENELRKEMGLANNFLKGLQFIYVWQIIFKRL